jgi:hypothetical protein
MQKATISVMNVYESDFTWPANTRITHLRIAQVIPKPSSQFGKLHNTNIAYRNTPPVGYSEGAMVRYVLGTVPVEEDGSAYFYAPIEREIYFQALDKRGRAVQSMLSATYVHPGEQMTCVGCHEDKWTAPSASSYGTPMALRRAPSDITPEPDGSFPLSYYKLAKPVFDGKCTPCHQQQGKGISFGYWDHGTVCELNGTHPSAGELEKFVTYYNAAFPWAGFCNNINSFNAARSQVGNTGALACSLTTYLDSSHHGVRLTDEEYRRAVLWMDMNSLELGTYDVNQVDSVRAGHDVWPRYPYAGLDPANPTGVQQDGAVVGAVQAAVPVVRTPEQILVRADGPSSLICRAPAGSTRLVMTSVLGRVVLSLGLGQSHADRGPVRISTDRLATGTYLVQAHGAGRRLGRPAQVMVVR